MAGQDSGLVSLARGIGPRGRREPQLVPAPTCPPRRGPAGREEGRRKSRCSAHGPQRGGCGGAGQWGLSSCTARAQAETLGSFREHPRCVLGPGTLPGLLVDCYRPWDGSLSPVRDERRGHVHSWQSPPQALNHGPHISRVLTRIMGLVGGLQSLFQYL